MNQVQDNTRILWDLALVQAYLPPVLADRMVASTLPENHQHPVKLYAKIDVRAMYDSLWEALEKYRKTPQVPTPK